MKILMTGGGTGGHLYPAIAIADEIKRRYPNAEILFLGNKTSIESTVVPQKGYNFRTVPSRWFTRGRGWWNTLVEFFKATFTTIAGFFASLKIIGSFKPDLTIGTGGFVSVPVILASRFRGIKSYLHEQNAVPGLANKMTGKMCNKVFLGFAGAEIYFDKKTKTVLTGNPVRADFFTGDKLSARKKLGFEENDFIVFMFGGSLGSKVINRLAYRYMEEIQGKTDRCLILGSGERFIDSIEKQAESDEIKQEGIWPSNIKVSAFIDDMPACLAAADLVICRAGALSLAEVMVSGLPSILIPYPLAADDHQYYNAKLVDDAGAAIVIREENVNIEEVMDLIDELYHNPNRLKDMGKSAKDMSPFDAAKRIVSEIEKDWKQDE